MIINELLTNEEFLDLLDKDSSEDLLKYIGDLRFRLELTQNDLRRLGKMFNDLQIFTNVGIKSIESKRFIVTRALLGCRDMTIDLRNKILANASGIFTTKYINSDR